MACDGGFVDEVWLGLFVVGLQGLVNDKTGGKGTWEA